MANEVINLGTVFSGFNSGTDLQPKNTRTNNQGVTINDIAGFGKIVSAAPRQKQAGVQEEIWCLLANGEECCRKTLPMHIFRNLLLLELVTS